MILNLSASLNPNSRSRLLSAAATQHFSELGVDCECYDLSTDPLPPCDGASAYGDPAVKRLATLIERSEGVVIAAPVYNYDVNAAIKNAVELTGKAWTGNVVALMLAAGGMGSYMSGMGLANSLMLDFRCLIVPRFVYATGDAFDGDSIVDPEVRRRVTELVDQTVRLTTALR